MFDDPRSFGFIRRSRELGFPLDDIRTLLEIVDAGRLDFSATKPMTLRHLADGRPYRSWRKRQGQGR